MSSMPVVAPDAKITPEIIAVIQATAPVVAEHVQEITKAFYHKMFTRNPEVVRFFNQSHQREGLQSSALAAAVVAYATNIDNLGVLGDAVARMAHRHCALAILPEQYPVVHDNLMLTIGEVLGDAVTPEIANAWSQIVLVLANILVEAEEKLYRELETRAGGWRHEKELVLVEKTPVSSNVTTYRFKRSDYEGPFDFTPGQYLTLRHPNDTDAPRHYTITSAPGNDYFEITVRKLENCLMSAYLSDTLEVGSTIRACAPCGVFTPNPESSKNVLISAGIGITPIIAFARYYGGRGISEQYHVEKSKDAHAYADMMKSTGVKGKVTYTSEGGRPDLASDMKALVERNGTDATYYVCGPYAFIQDCEAALCEAGCTDVRSEMFGTGVVAKKCPMH